MRCVNIRISETAAFSSSWLFCDLRMRLTLFHPLYQLVFMCNNMCGCMNGYLSEDFCLIGGAAGSWCHKGSEKIETYVRNTGSWRHTLCTLNTWGSLEPLCSNAGQTCNEKTFSHYLFTIHIIIPYVSVTVFQFKVWQNVAAVTSPHTSHFLSLAPFTTRIKLVSLNSKYYRWHEES